MPTGYVVPPPPVVAANATVEANAGTTATLTVANFGKIQTNTGGGAGIVFTLPAVATVAGCAVKVQVTAAYSVTLTPASGEKIYLGGDGVASKYALIAGTVGNFVDLYCDGVQYLVLKYSGVVTKEA